MNVLESLTHPSAWAVHVVDPPLESYVGKGLRGRVALLGDAAHGMLPHLGAGAGQGMYTIPGARDKNLTNPNPNTSQTF